MMALRNLVIPIFIISAFITYAYGNLTGSFYEQEEWLGIGNTFIYGNQYLLQVLASPLKMLLGDGRILSGLVTYFFYSNFPFNTLPLSLLQITIHILNSLLVYLLLKKTVKKTLPAIMGSAFFAVNAVSQSAVTWSAAFSTLPATTLILLSLYLLFASTNNLSSVISKKYLIIALFLLYTSFLFKQIGVFMFALLPIAGIYMSSSQKRSFGDLINLKLVVPLAVFLFVVIAWLAYFKNISGPNALFLTGTANNFFQTLTVRSLLYPLTSFSLVFIPPEQFLSFARHITNLYYPFFPPEQFILIAQTVVLDLLSVILSFFIISVLVILSRRVSQSSKILWFLVAFTLASYLPYAIIAKSYSYLDSRYYYLAGVGASFLLAWILAQVSAKSKKWGWAFVILACLFILTHATTTRQEVKKQIQTAGERKQLLSQLNQQIPTLKENKNIFFVTGSSDFYLPGHKIPFQNGFGHTLAVWYYRSGKVPQEVIKNRSLFEFGSQGYYEYGNSGFGYFSDMNVLKDTVVKYNLPPTAVTAFYYDAESKSLINITQNALEELKEGAR